MSAGLRLLGFALIRKGVGHAQRKALWHGGHQVRVAEHIDQSHIVRHREADLFEVSGIAVTHAGKEMALFKREDGVYAINNLCTHGNAKLCDGAVDGNHVQCPFHQAQFSLRDGSVACGPTTEPAKTWPVKVEGGRVFLQLTV